MLHTTSASASFEAPLPSRSSDHDHNNDDPMMAEEFLKAEDDVPVSAPVSGIGMSAAEELADWKKVYEEFVRVKRDCGEATDGLTFDKFKGTLERNKAALVARHACSFVKFSVYVKDGKAALKASPVK